MGGQAVLGIASEAKSQSWDELDLSLRPNLERYARRILRHRHCDAEDVVQKTFAEVLKNYGNQSELPGPGLLFRITRNRALDACRKSRRESTTPFSGMQGHDDDSPCFEAADSRAATPSYIAGEQERLERKRDLVLKSLEEFCRQSSAREREVFERTVSGEDAETIAREMGIAKNYVYQLQLRLRNKLMAQFDQRDPHHSVFTWRDQREGQVVAPTTSMVLLELIDSGALCPALERLREYGQQPADVAFRDVAYHVEQAHCADCNAYLAGSGLGRK